MLCEDEARCFNPLPLGEFGEEDIMLVGELRMLLPDEELGAATIVLFKHSAARIFVIGSRSS